MFQKISNILSIASFVLIVSTLISAFFGYKYLSSEQFKNKIMNEILGNVQGMMPKILDNGLWRRKFRYDIIYYKRASFLLDIFILCRTINIIYGILRKKITFEENHTPLV